MAQAFRVAFEFWQAAKEGTHGCPFNDQCVTNEWKCSFLLVLTIVLYTKYVHVSSLSWGRAKTQHCYCCFPLSHTPTCMECPRWWNQPSPTTTAPWLNNYPESREMIQFSFASLLQAAQSWLKTRPGIDMGSGAEELKASLGQRCVDWRNPLENRTQVHASWVCSIFATKTVFLIITHVYPFCFISNCLMLNIWTPHTDGAWSGTTVETAGSQGAV